MSDNNSGIKASKDARWQKGLFADNIYGISQTQKRKRAARPLEACYVQSGLGKDLSFGTIYGISHLLHKHTDTKEVAKTSQKQTAKKGHFVLPKKN